jgi:hypothetical protein
MTQTLAQAKQAAYQREYRKRHPRVKAKEMERIKESRFLLSVLKMAVGCIDCGYRQYPEALDFDHVRGDKVLSVSGMCGFSLTKLITELEKCEVVCANCHRHRTNARLNQT